MLPHKIRFFIRFPDSFAVIIQRTRNLVLFGGGGIIQQAGNYSSPKMEETFGTFFRELFFFFSILDVNVYIFEHVKTYVQLYNYDFFY